MLGGVLFIVFGWCGGIYLLYHLLDFLAGSLLDFLDYLVDISSSGDAGYFWPTVYVVVEEVSQLILHNNIKITIVGILVSLYLFFGKIDKIEKRAKK